MAVMSTWTAHSLRASRTFKNCRSRIGCLPLQFFRSVPLEAHEESNRGFRCPNTTGNRQVILQKVGRDIDQLPESNPHAEMAIREVPVDSECVVIRCAKLLWQALSTEGCRLEPDRAPTETQEWLKSEWPGTRVSNIAKGHLPSGGLGATGQNR